MTETKMFRLLRIPPIIFGSIFTQFRRHNENHQTPSPSSSSASSPSSSPSAASSPSPSAAAAASDDASASAKLSNLAEIPERGGESKSTAQIPPHSHLLNTNVEQTKLDIRYERSTAISRFRMALNGNPNCANLPVVHQRHQRTALQLEEALKNLVVDDEWLDVIRWSTIKFCDESDLACGEEMIGRRTSQELRLNALLNILVAKTENGFGEELIEQDILSILDDFCANFEHTNRILFVTTMKLLANICAQNENCAMALAHSGWLQRLAAMVSMNSLEENLLAKKVCINALNALLHNNIVLGTDIYELYRTNNNNDDDDDDELAFDLILIHGIRGGVFRTWRAKDDPNTLPTTRCWPRDWLPYDVSVPMRILALDYASSILRFRGVPETLASRSKRFQKQLRAAGVGKRPAVFIGHSMGGLLVKRLLLDDEEILKQTVGILFIATPHRGSPFAKFARYALRPTDDIVMLGTENETNRKLHEAFLSISTSIPVICSMAETEHSPLPLHQKGVLVPSESAFFERGPLYHIRDIHYNICKPSGPHDNAYGVILQFLNDVVFHLNKRT